MTQNDVNNWIMYHEIHKLQRMGFSNSKIARHLAIDSRTVSKYLKMSEEEFEQFLLKTCNRTKILTPYESFVYNKLEKFPDTSAAQIHDWLKEYNADLVEVTPRTVYNFVLYIRQKYNIPYIPKFREYFPVSELAYGEQAQVDFGYYNMRMQSGKRKKVSFFVMVLARSRMKYIYFIDTSFTSQLVIYAHEKAFEFFTGIPKTIVYDQDRTIIVDENLGEIILTSEFKAYTKSRNFNLHFCRKADPESKGKVENVVQYVKKNFLYNRLYYDLETLNIEAIAWLSRTANYLAHSSTKKSPEIEFFIEKEYLESYVPIAIEVKKTNTYFVRKDNTISYKSNYYTLPMGTYKGNQMMVPVVEQDGMVKIYDPDNKLICTHKLSLLKGKTISNTHHKRDISGSIEKMINNITIVFTKPEDIIAYLQQIKLKYPRYIRDHLQIIQKAIKDVDSKIIDKTLCFCIKNELFHAREFEESMYVQMDDESFEETIKKKQIYPANLNNQANSEKANQTPQTSNIIDYENIINSNN